MVGRRPGPVSPGPPWATIVTVHLKIVIRQTRRRPSGGDRDALTVIVAYAPRTVSDTELKLTAVYPQPETQREPMKALCFVIGRQVPCGQPTFPEQIGITYLAAPV
jgi:hypothetical protein